MYTGLETSAIPRSRPICVVLVLVCLGTGQALSLDPNITGTDCVLCWGLVEFLGCRGMLLVYIASSNSTRLQLHQYVQSNKYHLIYRGNALHVSVMWNDFHHNFIAGPVPVSQQSCDFICYFMYDLCCCNQRDPWWSEQMAVMVGVMTVSVTSVVRACYHGHLPTPPYPHPPPIHPH